MKPVRIKALLGAILLVAFLVVEVGGPVYNTKAPLFALVSAAASSLSLIPKGQEPLGSIVHGGILLLSAGSGVSAAWYWFLTNEQVAPQWQMLAILLVLVSISAIASAPTSYIRNLERHQDETTSQKDGAKE